MHGELLLANDSRGLAIPPRGIHAHECSLFVRLIVPASIENRDGFAHDGSSFETRQLHFAMTIPEEASVPGWHSSSGSVMNDGVADAVPRRYSVCSDDTLGKRL